MDPERKLLVEKRIEEEYIEQLKKRKNLTKNNRYNRLILIERGTEMSRINMIQQAILSLSGGAYHNLLDQYIYNKRGFENIHSFGVQTGTDNSTKGIPDSYVEHEDGTLTLIMYGTVRDQAFSKLKKDILSSLNKYEKEIENWNVKEVIAAYTSTNISPSQLSDLKSLNENVDISFISLSTLSQDLLLRYPHIAADHLNIPIDSEQIYTPDEFIKRYDKNEMNTPLSIDFKFRNKEMSKVINALESSSFILVTGESGVGKTKLVVEACKQYEKINNVKVFCIKNNELPIYQDMRFYFGDEGEYLLFIDDVNETMQLDFILEFILDPPEGVTIKVIATVRDYAKLSTLKKIIKKIKVHEITIDKFSSEEITTILNETLEIRHEVYLKRITDISKGNIRLAILAGIAAKEKGYPAIKNASDIFKNYYEVILDSQRISKDQILVLFIVSLIGSFRLRENKFAAVLLEEFNMSEEMLLDICHQLNESELIDFYEDEVVRMSNQNFRDYILEYTLISKRYVRISRLLDIGFPKFKQKIILALNILSDIFYSADTIKYIQNEVNASWANAEAKDTHEYLVAFYRLNELKALNSIKRNIDKMGTLEIDLIPIEEPNTNNNISDDFITVLGGFNHSEHAKDAIELLVTYFNKRPDLFEEFYAVFTTHYSYDEYSHHSEYQNEYHLVETLWRLSNQGENNNLNILMIQVFREFLKCVFNRVESGENFKTVTFFNLEINYSEGIKKIRRFIWEKLSVLYQYDCYQESIHSILTQYNGGIIDEKLRLIYNYDLKCIKENFRADFEQPNFFQSLVLYSLKDRAVSLEIGYADFYNSYQKNEEFMLYNLLSETYSDLEHLERKEFSKTKLANLIEGYTVNDYDELFKKCFKFQKMNLNNNWSIPENLATIFSILEEDNLYTHVVKIYIKQDTPFDSRSYENIISNLIQSNGVDQTIDILNQKEYKSKNKWLSKFWELLPENEVSESLVTDLLVFIDDQKDKETVFIPSVQHLEKYYVLDKNIIKKIVKLIFEMKSVNDAVNHFFNIIVEDDLNIIKKIFSKDMKKLEKLYILNRNPVFDFDGILLMYLVENNIEFWNIYTKVIAEYEIGDTYFSEKIKLIWDSDNYYELVERAYENLVLDKYVFLDEQWARTIFLKDNHYKSRTKKWTKDYIQNNVNEIGKIRSIFRLINYLFENELIEFYTVFLDINKKIENFKQLPLFPNSYSWSGSFVPTLNKEIDFIQKLIISLNGIEFLEHKAYLNEELSYKEKERKETEIKEYMSDLI